MQKYLQETEIIDFSNPAVKILAQELSLGLFSDKEIAQSCFIYVRDEIHHSGDSYDEMIHNFPDIKNA